MYKNFNIFAPFLKLYIICNNKKPSINIIGIKAGYITKEADRFPSRRRRKLRCKPHPKQFIPIVLFIGHCSKCSFKKCINCSTSIIKNEKELPYSSSSF